MRTRLMLALSFALSLLAGFSAHAEEQQGLEIYVVRHAETESNRTGIHNRVNDRTFSTTGLNQVRILTERLGDHRFDHIIVSPKYRAMNTILPYLKKNRLVAEIWPELEECCWQREGRNAVSSGLERGKKVEVPDAMRPYFRLRDHGSSHRYKARNYADGILQVQMAADLIKKRFGGTNQSVLLVGHYHAGGRIMELLLGQEPEGRFSLENTKISLLEQQPSGHFRLIYTNR